MRTMAASGPLAALSLHARPPARPRLVGAAAERVAQALPRVLEHSARLLNELILVQAVPAGSGRLLQGGGLVRESDGLRRLRSLPSAEKGWCLRSSGAATKRRLPSRRIL